MCKTLLQATASARPTCEQIMAFPTFSKKFEKYFPEEHLAFQNDQQDVLLKTIRFPKNLMYLTDRLPKHNYKNNVLSASLDEHALTGISSFGQGNTGMYSSIDGSMSRKNIHHNSIVSQSVAVSNN